MSKAAHIDKVEYPYKISKGGIRIVMPDKKIYIKMDKFTGINNDDLERAQWKGYWPKIGPRHVKKYIIDNLLKGK